MCRNVKRRRAALNDRKHRAPERASDHLSCAAVWRIHEKRAVAYETAARRGVRAGIPEPPALPPAAAESLHSERLAGSAEVCPGSRGTAVAVGGSVARQVAAHFIKQAAAPQYALQAAVQLIREDSMFQLVNYVKSFARNEEGQDLLEYALLVALIALIAIGAVGLAGESVSTIFTNIADALSATS